MPPTGGIGEGAGVEGAGRCHLGSGEGGCWPLMWGQMEGLEVPS